MSWKLTGKNADGTDVNYEDLPVRIAVSDFVKEVFGWNVISNNNDKFAIDLISEDGNCPDIECERSNCKKPDYWSTKGFSEFLRDATPSIPYRTLNFQQRKEHYWVEGDHYKSNGKFWYTEKNHLTNIFIRTTFHFEQMNVVRPHIIRDESKLYRAMKKPYRIHKNELEPWVGIRKHDVDVWNKKNGVWILEEVIKPIELVTI